MAQQTEKEFNAIKATWTVKEIKPNSLADMYVYYSFSETSLHIWEWMCLDSGNILLITHSAHSRFMGRADQVVSEDSYKTRKKKKNMWKRLCWNVMVIRTGPWRYHKKKELKKELNVRQKQGKHTSVGIPYIQGLSEQLQRIFKKHGACTYHKPTNKLKEILSETKGQNTHGTTIWGGIITVKIEVKTCYKVFQLI